MSRFGVRKGSLVSVRSSIMLQWQRTAEVCAGTDPDESTVIRSERSGAGRGWGGLSRAEPSGAEPSGAEPSAEPEGRGTLGAHRDSEGKQLF